MAAVRDSFIDLEKRRRQLEQNVTELRGLLQHWQTWEAEYEGLKEELEGLGSTASRQEIQAVTEDYEATLLNAKEISQLVKDDKGNDRDARQILGLLARRIDYVQENVKTVQKRYDDAELKLERINVVMQPSATDEEGLPLTEITEELDDNDNVISHTLQKPGDMAPQILEALKKQGVTDIPASSPVPSKTLTASSTARDPVANTSSRVLEEEEDEAMVEDVAKDEQRLRSRSDSMKTKKVSFAETTKPSVEETKPVPKTVHQDVVEKLADEGLIPEPLHDPVIPENETPEQAALRQDMLQYNMNDIGKIVAEINLDEQTDDEVYSDEDNDVYAYDSEMEEDEDQWGRSKVKVMSDEYREEMLEIERKLNAKSLFNAGPNGEVDSLDVESKDDSDDEREFATKRNTSSNAKKGVKFAQSLDVQEAPAPKGTSRPAQEPSLTDTPKERPLADSIVERAAPATVSSEPAPKPKRVSAFKAARASESSGSNEPASKKKSGVVTNGPLAGMPSTRLMSAVEKQNRAFASIPPDVYNPSVVPEGPQDRTLAETLVEHPVLETDDAAAQAPDELDPALMRQEIATEYHKIRNRMIQRNGGFTRSQDEDEDPEADADKPRVSRFKAARLAKVAK